MIRLFSDVFSLTVKALGSWQDSKNCLKNPPKWKLISAVDDKFRCPAAENAYNPVLHYALEGRTRERQNLRVTSPLQCGWRLVSPFPGLALTSRR